MLREAFLSRRFLKRFLLMVWPAFIIIPGVLLLGPAVLEIPVSTPLWFWLVLLVLVAMNFAVQREKRAR